MYMYVVCTLCIRVQVTLGEIVEITVVLHIIIGI